MCQEKQKATAQAAAAESVFFRALPEEEIACWLSDPRCVQAAYAKGDAIYAPQQFQRRLGLLLTGTIQVSKGPYLISILCPGELFGAAALFSQAAEYPATLTAHTACSVLFFPRELVEERLDACPAASRSYIVYLSERVRFLTGKIEGLTAGSTGRKLARYLLGQSSGGAVELDCSATTLAKWLHVSRASLYRAFDALTASGAIARSGRTVRLLDPELLRHL